jgi:hypothetical protein
MSNRNQRRSVLQPLFDNEKRTGALGTGNSPSGSAADMGLDLLSNMTGWWDGSTYSGSGDLLNSGTGGSSLDLTISGPSFSSGVFTFDGVNDKMECSDSSAFDVAAGESMSIGWIGQRLTTGSNGQRFIDKDGGIGGKVWLLRTTTSSTVGLFNVNDLVQSANPVQTGTFPAPGANHLFVGQRDMTTVTAKMSVDGIDGTAVALTSTGSPDNANDFHIGGNNQGGTTGFSNMTMLCAFFCKFALSYTQQRYIAAAYGLTI